MFAQLSSFGMLLPILISLLAFSTVALLVYGLAPTLIGRHGARRRLPVEAIGAVEGGSLRQNAQRTFWSTLVRALEERGIALSDSNPGVLRSRLMAAGYTHPDASRIYVLTRIALTLALPGLYLFAFLSTGTDVPLMKLYALATFLAVIGLYLPNLWIGLRTRRRQRDLTNGFPDALDLMLVCVEAGLGLDAAFNRVGAELVRSNPSLSEQLAIVTLELRAGRSREDALRGLAERSGVEEIRAFTTLLVQSERLGASIGQTLRIYAAEMRERRRMRAEEKAHRIPVLISLPLVGLMLPTMIGVLILPAAIRYVREVSPVMGGG